MKPLQGLEQTQASASHRPNSAMGVADKGGATGGGKSSGSGSEASLLRSLLRSPSESSPEGLGSESLQTSAPSLTSPSSPESDDVKALSFVAKPTIPLIFTTASPPDVT